MLAIEPCGLGCAQEELRAVGVLAGIGHRQHARSLKRRGSTSATIASTRTHVNTAENKGGHKWCHRVLECEVLVFELLAVDRLPTRAVVVGEVASLAHEVGDHTMKRTLLESESRLASTELAEVLCGGRKDAR